MDKKIYVTMTDKFLSGWGMAKGKTNKLIIECDTMDEALIVEENARNRGEMKHINIRMSKPSYNPSVYFTSFHNKDDYGAWFQKGYFKKKV